MFKPLNLPRCVANLFSLGDSDEIRIVNMWEKRPDLILTSVGQQSMKSEIINNYISNKSPITLKTGDYYTITDNLFNTYFFNN